MTVVQVAGPAIGGPIGLGPGRHLVGRAPGAAVRLTDPHVEAHHAVLDVGADGAVTILQLAGRVPIIVGDGPVDGPTPVGPHVTVELGASRLLVAASARGRCRRHRRVGGRPLAALGVARARCTAADPVAPLIPPPPPADRWLAGGG